MTHEIFDIATEKPWQKSILGASLYDGFESVLNYTNTKLFKICIH